MRRLETLSKRAAIGSVLAILFLQVAVHPDLTWMLRAAVTVSFALGWLAARGTGEYAHAAWLFLAPVAPALLWTATGRLGEPLLDLFWMAGLAGSLTRTISWSRWAFPAGWAVLLGGWALALALAWPVLVAREVAFDATLFRDPNAINSWANLSAPQVVAWTLYVTGCQLLALLWFDWICGRDEVRRNRLPLPLHGLWIGVTVASVAAIWQGTVDVTWLNTEFWAALQRAGGTMLNPNAYGVAAAFAGPVGFLAVRMWRTAGDALAPIVLAINWVGTWMSGSRTALICMVAGAVGLAFGLWRSPLRRGGVATASAAMVAFVAIVAVAASREAGPLRRLMDGPLRNQGVTELWNRGHYGPIAMQIIRDYPLTGVGPGAYHYLAPDYERVAVDERLEFDNAQNWWRHQAAELGIFGGLFLLAWSALLAWRVATAPAEPAAPVAAAVTRTLIAGLGLTSLVGMPTQDPRVLIFFFALVAWLAQVTIPPLVASAPRPRWVTAGWMAGTALAVAFAVGHLWLASGELSVAARAARTGRAYAAGAHGPEQGDGTPPFRWTDDESRFVWPAQTPWLLLSLWVHHPNVADDPVRVTVTTPCGVLFDRPLASAEAVDVAVPLPAGTPTVDATVEVSRTWRPSLRGDDDRRELGAAVAARFLEDAAELDDAEFRASWPQCDSARD